MKRMRQGEREAEDQTHGSLFLLSKSNVLGRRSRNAELGAFNGRSVWDSEGGASRPAHDSWRVVL